MLEWFPGTELVARAPRPLDSSDGSALAVAIREQWPDASPIYWNMVARRFRAFYESLPEDDAVKAIQAGYSSPAAAFRARVIRKRKYLGANRDGT